MALILSDVKVTSIHSGADAFNGDDPVALIQTSSSKEAHSIFNLSKGGNAQFGFPMDTGNSGFIAKELSADNNLTPLRKFFNNAIVISLIDTDGNEFQDFGDNISEDVGSFTYISTGKELVGVPQSHLETVGGSGSFYQLQFNITQPGVGTVPLTPRHPAGKIASKGGGVMQGSNTAGTLVGLGGKDVIFGNNGDDIIVGGAGDDTLNGGKGDDIIFGGKGNNTLSGGAGSDLFVIAPNNGKNTIVDFHKGQDLIALGGGLKFENITSIESTKGTSIEAGGEQLAFLRGIHTPLTVSDFTQIDLGNLNSRVKADVAALTKKPSLAA